MLGAIAKEKTCTGDPQKSQKICPGIAVDGMSLKVASFVRP